MQSTRYKLWLAAGLCVLALGGCGGGGGGNIGDGVATVAPDPVPADAVPTPLEAGAAVVQYILGLIAGTNETDDPIDTSAVTLALDDAADAADL